MAAFSSGASTVSLNAPWRRFMLLLHVTTSVGLLGAVVAFLSLAVVGMLDSDDPLTRAVYPSMQVMTWWVVVPLAGASLLIGIVQSLGTPWGLFRYYWVIVKLVLTIIAVAVLIMQMPTIDLLSQAATESSLGTLMVSRISMMAHAAGGSVVLLTATALSIYKPRGMTAYGQARAA